MPVQAATEVGQRQLLPPLLPVIVHEHERHLCQQRAVAVRLHWHPHLQPSALVPHVGLLVEGVSDLHDATWAALEQLESLGDAFGILCDQGGLVEAHHEARGAGHELPGECLVLWIRGTRALRHQILTDLNEDIAHLLQDLCAQLLQPHGSRWDEQGALTVIWPLRSQRRHLHELQRRHQALHDGLVPPLAKAPEPSGIPEHHCGLAKSG
mmetsp:Transcript_26440/g.66511  ORF Transcript_26440/g.66511 Transcript_26440/m.66511 type:complete len:210 (-) Transcript_26440:195-824(-)